MLLRHRQGIIRLSPRWHGVPNRGSRPQDFRGSILVGQGASNCGYSNGAFGAWYGFGDDIIRRAYATNGNTFVIRCAGAVPCFGSDAEVFLTDYGWIALTFGTQEYTGPAAGSYAFMQARTDETVPCRVRGTVK